MLTFDSMMAAIRHSASYDDDARHYFDGRHTPKQRKPRGKKTPGPPLRPALTMVRDDEDRVRCLDASTGTHVWRTVISLY